MPYMRRLGAVHEPLAARYVNGRTRGLTLKIRRENGLPMLIRLPDEEKAPVRRRQQQHRRTSV